MRSLIDTVERVLASDLLTPDLLVVPDRGATEEELATALDVDRPPYRSLIQVLRRWNGLDLETLRIHGVGVVPDGIRSVHPSEAGLVFASDPAGFAYAINDDGSVSSLDHDSGSVSRVADDFEDFLCNLVFGDRAVEFAGDEWAADVASALGNA